MTDKTPDEDGKKPTWKWHYCSSDTLTIRSYPRALALHDMGERVSPNPRCNPDAWGPLGRWMSATDRP